MLAPIGDHLGGLARYALSRFWLSRVTSVRIDGQVSLYRLY